MTLSIVPNLIRRRLPLACVVPAMLVLCAGGCAQDRSDQTATGPGETRTARKGPVKLTFTVTPSDLDFSQHAEARLEVVSEPGVTVNVYDYGRAVRESEHRFEIGVVRSDKRPDRPTDDGKLISTYRYEIEFFLPGEYELPPAMLTFMDKRGRSNDSETRTDAAEVTLEELQTEPITITARDESGRQLSPEELRTIKTLAPIELPTVWSRWWWLGPVIAVLIMVAAVLLIPRLRQLLARGLRGAGREKVIVIPAHEWAWRQLAALVAEGLVGKGLFQEFHYRLSYIVRGYIERRYDVSAGEMTTEEFLEAAVTDSRFGPETTTELRRFLGVCDLVKYARHEPTSTESEGAFEAAGTFVERTRERSPAEAARMANRPVIEERAA